MTRFWPRDDLLSWGRVLRARHDVARPTWRDELPALLEEGARGGERTLLAVGLGRSYGDSGLNPNGAVIDMTGFNRAISFDPNARLLRAEAGVSLDTLLKILVRRGFFLPVTPGTRFVTLGGAVANDVHGKNHHRAGAFGRWIRRMGLLRSDGRELELGPDDLTGLFSATIGGLGLTGVITWVEIEVIPIPGATVEVETLAFGNLDEFFEISAESDEAFDYTVSWIDCLAKGRDLGRGLFSRGDHSTKWSRLPGSNRFAPVVPVEFPGFALNSLTVKTFNSFYYWRGRRRRARKVVPYQSFFYPLDAIGHWNRIYGRRGMYQYQSVTPPETSRDAVKAMLETVSRAGQGSFLAVLKTFGDKKSPGLLSFPRSGTTLALDFPNSGSSTTALMQRLDSIVREAGGRLYPAKDGRMPAEMFQNGYPEWLSFKQHVDPRFSSHFWRRVGL